MKNQRPKQRSKPVLLDRVLVVIGLIVAGLVIVGLWNTTSAAYDYTSTEDYGRWEESNQNSSIPKYDANATRIIKNLRTYTEDTSISMKTIIYAQACAYYGEQRREYRDSFGRGGKVPFTSTQQQLSDFICNDYSIVAAQYKFRTKYHKFAKSLKLKPLPF